MKVPLFFFLRGGFVALDLLNGLSLLMKSRNIVVVSQTYSWKNGAAVKLTVCAPSNSLTAARLPRGSALSLNPAGPNCVFDICFE